VQRDRSARGVYRSCVSRDLETLMSTPDPGQVDGTIEECVDDIDEFVATLDKYPETVLAFALRVHLGGLLRALIERGVFTREQVTELVRDLARETLHGYDG
jgi:hypothetical protein